MHRVSGANTGSGTVLLGLDPSSSAVKSGHVSGVHHTLKNAFLSCLRCTHPSAVPVTISFITKLDLDQVSTHICYILLIVAGSSSWIT